MTLADATRLGGQALLGKALWDTGERDFPLLVKLIDAAEWLSIQVHPDDALAAELLGPGSRGKTEAWYAIEAEPGAEIIAGTTPGTTPGDLARSIREGTIESIVERMTFRSEDVIGLPAGTIHALGPGVFLYEIQQSSDTTYRVFDWNRPSTAERPLHLEESLRAIDPNLRPKPARVGDGGDGELMEIVSMAPFVLSRCRVERRSLQLETHDNTFFVATVIAGAARIDCAGEIHRLDTFDSVVIPAAARSSRISGNPAATVLVASPHKQTSEG